MGRRRGRFFTTRFERDRQDRLIRQQQDKFGTAVTWFFLAGATVDSVFDEPDVMGGRTFTQAARSIPVLSAVPLEGPNVPGDAGRYVTNRVVLRMSLRQVLAAGMPDLSRDFEERYGDRFVLRGLVYDVTAIATEGNFDATNEDVVVRVEGRQLRADELTSDPDFIDHARNLVDWVASGVEVAGQPVLDPLYSSPFHLGPSGPYYDPAGGVGEPMQLVRDDAGDATLREAE